MSTKSPNKNSESKQLSSDLTISEKINDTARMWAPALNILILVLISAVAILCRVFSVIRYESIIHEFDPWFNYRTT